MPLAFAVRECERAGCRRFLHLGHRVLLWRFPAGAGLTRSLPQRQSAANPTGLGYSRGDPQKAGIAVVPALRVTLVAWRVSGSVSAVASASRTSRTPRADIDVLRREAIEILQATIGFDRWCSLLLDPDTLVISQGIGHNDWSSRPAAPQPARGRPRRRQQPRHARAQPQSRGHPERGDRRRSRPLRAAGATSSRATAWATSSLRRHPTSAGAGATSASAATATTRPSSPRTRS